MTLTDEQKRVYLAANGVRCPRCGYEQVEGGNVDIDAGSARQPVWCLRCNAEWTDVYTLTGLTEER